MPDLHETTTGTILSPTGELLTRPTVVFTAEEAKLLRLYKKFLDAHHLKEALYCQDCWNLDLHDGCKAFVKDSQILIECRCKLRFYQGMTL